MKLYIITAFDPSGLTDKIIKVFSSKENLDKWMHYASLMHQELSGEYSPDFTKHYKIRECTMDNLDYIDLYDQASKLGSPVKPSQP